MPDSPEIQQTVDAVARGNADEFVVIYRKYGPIVRAYLATHLFYMDDVDDIAQETFVAAYRSLHNFRPGEDFGAWLRGIAHHRLIRFYSQTSRRTTALERFRQDALELLEGEIGDAAGNARSEELQAMLKCIAKLPDR